MYDKTWTLFLDRDGVINRRLPDAYVRRWSEFIFEPDVPEAIAILSKFFGRIVVVTNQQGIGKGLMSEADLLYIHRQMVAAIERAGGRIDRVYHCPHLRSDACACRKPQTGMAQQAQADFPDINWTRSVMVGDMPSDIEFGRNAGMQTVFISATDYPPPFAGAHFAHLRDFAHQLKTHNF
ncbi:MAG TPA: HAD family hydrolase [Saprospiraceae bacterium]|nr:HAD family hydrolase [Saprospiraceae bacterium]HMP25452.1 HAD family hydrolase [Saprospiraceae bacterium]